MHTYGWNDKRSLWEVGYYVLRPAHHAPMNSEWNVVKTFDDEMLAARFANYLNGGSYLELPKDLWNVGDRRNLR